MGEAREAGRRGMDGPHGSRRNSRRNRAPGPGMALISLTVHFPQTFQACARPAFVCPGLQNFLSPLRRRRGREHYVPEAPAPPAESREDSGPSGRKCVVARGDHGAVHRNLRSWPEAAGRAPCGSWERRGLAGTPDGVFMSASKFVRASRPPDSARLGVAVWPHWPRAGHCRPEVGDRSWSLPDRLHVPVPFPGWAA